MTALTFIEKAVDFYFACLPRHQPDKLLAQNIQLIAHRGAHDKRSNVIENTHAAFERALDLGCWGIEFDVHACADGTLVVNHDISLKRLWGYDIKISDLRFDEVRELVPEIPSLEEVIGRYGKKMHLFIELKLPFTLGKCLSEQLSPLTPCLDYHIISLDEPLLSALIPFFPQESLLLVPLHNNVGKFCDLALKKNYGGVLGHYFLLRDAHIQRLKEGNKKFGVGFVDTKFSLYRELNRGIPWIFSNNITVASKELRALQGS